LCALRHLLQIRTPCLMRLRVIVIVDGGFPPFCGDAFRVFATGFMYSHHNLHFLMLKRKILAACCAVKWCNSIALMHLFLKRLKPSRSLNQSVRTCAATCSLFLESRCFLLQHGCLICVFHDIPVEKCRRSNRSQLPAFGGYLSFVC